MAVTTKTWSDGQPLTATYNGSGGGTITITTGVNEGADRTATLTVKTTDGSKSQNISIIQEGKRENFIVKTNQVFRCTDGDFLVLK